MTNKQPVGAIEQRLMKKENWSMASSVDCYWHEDECRCDLCGKKISGRHMIDGKRGDSYEFGLCVRAVTEAKEESSATALVSCILEPAISDGS